MDPSATLASIRRILSSYGETVPPGADHYELVELVASLDEWITNGGFLPDDWVTLPNATQPSWRP